jgi:hypothetical protein
LATFYQQPVAFAVAQAVIHLLEIIEVEEHHRERTALAGREGQRVAYPVPEQCPVGQPGERIVKGLVGELLLELLPLAHVPHIEHDAGDGGIGHEVGADGLRVQPGAIGPPHPPFRRLGDAPPPDRVGQESAQFVQVVRMDKVGQRGAQQPGGIISEHPPHRGADEAQRGIRIDNENHVAGMLDQGTKPHFVLPGRGFGQEPHVLADREELADQDQPGDQDGAQGDTADRVNPPVQGDHHQQAVGDRRGDVGQRAQRLGQRGGSDRLRRCRHRTAQVECPAGDHQDVVQQVNRVGPRRGSAAKVDQLKIENQVCDDADQRGDHQQSKGAAIPIGGAAQQHRGNPQEHQHAGQGVGKGEQDDGEIGLAAHHHRPDHEIPVHHRPAYQDGGRVEGELAPFERGAPRQREGQQRHQGDQVAGEVEGIGPRHRRADLEHRPVEDRDRIAQQDGQGRESEEPQGAAHLGIQ